MGRERHASLCPARFGAHLGDVEHRKARADHEALRAAPPCNTGSRVLHLVDPQGAGDVAPCPRRPDCALKPLERTIKSPLSVGGQVEKVRVFVVDHDYTATANATMRYA